AAAANGLFAVGGGHVFAQDGSGSLTNVVDRVDVYDSSAGRWNSSPLALSVPRDYPLVQAVGNYIIFAGGTDKSKDLDILDTRSGKFVENLQHRPSLYLLRSDAAATTVDSCLMIIAGGRVYQGANATASQRLLLTYWRILREQQVQVAQMGSSPAHRYDSSALGLANSDASEKPLEAPSGVQTTALSEHQSSENTRYAAKTLVIGGIAGCTAKTVVAPLDRVKILFQTHNTKFSRYAGTHFGLFKASSAIYREYGIRGLYQGHSMQLARIFPYAAIKYMSYEQLKMILGKRIDDQHVRNFLAGSLCGIIS
ncbi:coenzyme A transporter, partial [Coemansia erecta]